MVFFKSKYYTDLTDFHINVPCLDTDLLNAEFSSWSEEQLYIVIWRASMFFVKLLYDESDVNYLCMS